MNKGQLLSAECGRLGIKESWYRGIPTGAGNQIAMVWKKEKREPDDSRTEQKGIRIISGIRDKRF